MASRFRWRRSCKNVRNARPGVRPGVALGRSRRNMPAHRSNRLLNSIFVAAALLGGPALALAGPTAATAPATSPASLPSSAAFDALFKRLDIGDLMALSTAEQLKVVKQLEQLLPPGDTHRARMLDTQRCGLDFINANQKGYEFRSEEHT